jgi:hypothetical protein
LSWDKADTTHPWRITRSIVCPGHEANVPDGDVPTATFTSTPNSHRDHHVDLHTDGTLPAVRLYPHRDDPDACDLHPDRESALHNPPDAPNATLSVLD